MTETITIDDIKNMSFDVMQKNQYVFNHTQDSYSVDMFLRYLNNINE